MFIGHFAVAFAAKKAVPKTPLPLLFLAAQFLDVLWPVFMLAGIERAEVDIGNTAFTNLNFISYPYSHSLLMSLVWAVLFGGVAYAVRRSRREPVGLAALVFSHWVLDFLTHGPDLPLLPGVDVYWGMGLWNSAALTYLVEGALYGLGAWVYVSSTAATSTLGRVASWALVLALPALWLTNQLSPPPPDLSALAITVLVGVAAIVAWAAWADRLRPARQ